MFGSFTQKKSHFGLIWENRGIRIFHSEKTLKLLTKMTTRSHSIFWSWIQRSQIILNKPYKWRSLIHKCLIGHLWRRELYSYNMSLIIYDVISVAITYLVFLLMCTILNLLHHVVLNIYSINAFSRIFFNWDKFYDFNFCVSKYRGCHMRVQYLVLIVCSAYCAYWAASCSMAYSRPNIKTVTVGIIKNSKFTQFWTKIIRTWLNWKLGW